MDMIVVGCGRVGAALAFRLFQREHRVTVIDSAPQAFKNLPPSFRGRTLEGDALDQSVLRRAGIAKAHGLAAVTNAGNNGNHVREHAPGSHVSDCRNIGERRPADFAAIGFGPTIRN